MKINRGHWWAGGVAALVLILFWSPWSGPSRGPEPATGGAGKAKFTAPAEALWRPPVPLDAECATCPPGVAAAKKSGYFTEEYTWEEAFRNCWEFLKEAAADGIPNPDTSHLENCSSSPLAYADTVDQTRKLIDAGADLNHRGEFGLTPLHQQMRRMVLRPTEERHALVLELIDAGADPWIENDLGELPYDSVRNAMGTSSLTKLQAEERLRQEMASRGLTEEQVFSEKPAVAKAMEEIRQAPDFPAKSLMALRDSMERTNPDRMKDILR